MKKLLLQTISVLAIVTGLTACDNTEKEIKDFLVQFAEAVQKGDKNKMAEFYSDAAQADSIAFVLNPGSLTIEQVDESTYNVKISQDVDMVMSKDDKGAFHIIRSHGLFAYPPERLRFATATGQFKPDLDDAANALRMKDYRFVDHLVTTFNTKLKGGIIISDADTYGDDYYEGEWVSADGYVFTVTNKTNFNIPGSAYQIIYTSGYWGGGPRQTEIIQGQNVAAGSSVKLRSSKMGPNMESSDDYNIKVMGVSTQDFMRMYTPIGNEYEQFIKENGAPKSITSNLTLDLKGLMGNCGTRIQLNGSEGTMLYNPTSTSLDFGNNAEKRSLTLISYDKESGKLVLQVQKAGAKTGNLDGTYKNGVYEGQFKSTNGSSSSFSFK